METKGGIQLNKALLRILKRADALADSPEFLKAFNAALNDIKLQEKAIKDSHEYLKSRSVNVPRGLSVAFLRKAVPIRPTPDYEFFTIQLFRCKTYWVKKQSEKIVICFGFRIVPHPIPGGPIA